MIVLGIETSTRTTSVALGSRDGTIASRAVRGSAHVEILMPAVLGMCADAGVRLDELGGVAVGTGPGLFTGMRVGIQTAKTLAQTLLVPLVGASSLDLLAFGVRHTHRLICACVDAKRDEMFASLYRAVPGGVLREGDHRTWTPQALVAELQARREDVLLVGDAAGSYAQLRAMPFAEVAPAHPRAEHLVELAIPMLEREEFVAPAQLEPLYVRRSDAEIKWEQRGVVIERPTRVKLPKRAAGGAG